ncbi:MAG TPA: DUF3017 domain-containing protein [Sporichthyaceae bacterium]|nr:DUF3017 domain-containing protein [Sporichthyaceae bacterium]
MTGRHANRAEIPTPPVPGPPVAVPPRPAGEASSLAAEWPLLAVATVCGAGLIVVLSDHFRRGTVMFAGGLFLAAGLRAVLPAPVVGLLAVRGRVVDILTLLALALGVLLTALLVPPPS